MSLSVDSSTSSSSTAATSSSSSTSTSGTSTAPQLTETQQNLENILVQYGASESADVQALVERAATQLGVSYADVHTAALNDAQAKKDADAATKATADAAAKAASDAAKVTKRQHDKVEARRAAEAYRRHRINNWWSGFASQA